ncbi:MAG: hypothetical protein IJQ85_03055 [Selenomonadaceae bacterium]|nr:hypothetical protein [Selenomonadaceae bacterium]
MFESEKIRREELEILQLERLKKIAAWSYEKSNFYQKSFSRQNVAPEDIQKLSDVSKLPFLTREEIHNIDALDFLTLPLSSVVRVTRLDGIKKFYTKGDIRNNVEMMIRSFMAANILRGSTVELAGDLSDSRLLDALYALESIGATVIIGNADFIADVQISATSTEVKISKNISGRKSFKLFAPSEIGHAGLFCPCEFGYHLQEDNFLIEVLDGELVITTLTAQALPLIRYRTGLLIKKFNEPCPCGRTFIKIDI